MSEQDRASLNDRYRKFIQHLDDVNSPPVKVFNALPKECVKRLEIIREASRFLQEKKDNDMKLQAAAEAEMKANEEAQDKIDEEGKQE